MKKLIYLTAFRVWLYQDAAKLKWMVILQCKSSRRHTTENTILEGRITANRTLKADIVYKFRGLVYVTNGAILTIEPGTKIVGEMNKQGGLIITRSSKIIADGTAG